MQITDALNWARMQLTPISENPYLDAEVLLASVLNVSRVYLYAESRKELTDEQEKLFKKFVSRGMQGEPIAYITGHKEFWSLDFLVTPETLIPRPETELLVEKTLELLSKDPKIIADLGTGCGAIAIALAKERPNWTIHATDFFQPTLDIAKKNSERLQVKNVLFHQGSWCGALPPILFDALLSNPPYISNTDNNISPHVKKFEPHQALFSEQNGLKEIENIIMSGKKHLKTHGFLLIEHGFLQGEMVRCLFEKADYTNIDIYEDWGQKPRATIGYK